MSKNITNGRDEPQTAAALEARRVTAQAAHQRVHHVLARMRREKAPITVAAVARRAGVSRTFLYTNPEARTAVADAAAASDLQRAADLTAQDTEQEATWRERALNAEDALKAARTEIVHAAHPHRRAPGSGPGPAKPNGPRRPSSASPPRTPPSNSEYGSSPPTTGPWTNGSRPPGRTCASRTAASPTSKPSSQTPPPRPDRTMHARWPRPPSGGQGHRVFQPACTSRIRRFQRNPPLPIENM